MAPFSVISLVMLSSLLHSVLAHFDPYFGRTTVRSEDRCYQKYPTSSGDFYTQSFAIGMTTYNRYFCALERCVEDPNGGSPTLVLEQQDCKLRERRECVRLGDTFHDPDTCNDYECTTDGLEMKSVNQDCLDKKACQGCELPNGKCLKPGEEWYDDDTCKTYVCKGKGNVEYYSVDPVCKKCNGCTMISGTDHICVQPRKSHIFPDPDGKGCLRVRCRKNGLLSKPRVARVFAVDNNGVCKRQRRRRARKS